jgi:NAD+ kinase
MSLLIKKIKIIANDNLVCNNLLDILINKLETNGFVIDGKNPDLVIAIGGDGSFLRMVKQCEFNSNLIYVGINGGTLGFLQEIKMDNIDILIECLKNESYKIDEVGIQETHIDCDMGSYNYYSLNEIVIREKDGNTAIFDININGFHLENYVGDGILIATSIGSTAYNLSFGGSIVDNSFHTLQITPIAPLNNKAYRNLLNSVIIPENNIIEVIPKENRNDLVVVIDGNNHIYNKVKKIKTFVNNKRLKFLRLETYNFFEKINDKFLN